MFSTLTDRSAALSFKEKLECDGNFFISLFESPYFIRYLVFLFAVFFFQKINMLSVLILLVVFERFFFFGVHLSDVYLISICTVCLLCSLYGLVLQILFCYSMIYICSNLQILSITD